MARCTLRRGIAPQAGGVPPPARSPQLANRPLSFAHGRAPVDRATTPRATRRARAPTLRRVLPVPSLQPARAGGVGRSDRSSHDERDVLLPRGLPAALLRPRSCRSSTRRHNRGSACRLERGMLDRRRGYTIAMLVHASPGSSTVGRCASSAPTSRKRCIAAARRGVYGPRAFRATPREMRTLALRRAARRRRTCADRIRALCHFGQMNLLDDDARASGRTRRRRLLSQRAHLLRRARAQAGDRHVPRATLPGGVLLLGHSESLLNVSTAFELLHLQ